MSTVDPDARPREFWMLPCAECEQAMTGVRQRFTFEGDWSIVEIRFECRDTACQTEATVTYRTFIPKDIAEDRAAVAENFREIADCLDEGDES